MNPLGNRQDLYHGFFQEFLPYLPLIIANSVLSYQLSGKNCSQLV